MLAAHQAHQENLHPRKGHPAPVFLSFPYPDGSAGEISTINVAKWLMLRCVTSCRLGQAGHREMETMEALGWAG